MRENGVPARPPRSERRARSGGLASAGATIALLCVATAATVGVRTPVGRRPSPAAAPIDTAAPRSLPIAVASEPVRLGGAVVLGARRDWAKGRTRPVRLWDPVPVQLTAYCLTGTTRRDNAVRQGIVAADPKLFPLGRYVDVYIGRRYHGRFLVDDTGARIREGILDIWTPSCAEARRFGRRRGTAVLVPRPRGADPDTLLTGRLAGLTIR